MTTLDNASPDAAAGLGRIQAIIEASRVASMLYAMVELSLPEHLAAGPRSAAELAAATSTPAPLLLRLLRALTVIGLLQDAPDDGFALTPLGTALSDDAPGGLAAQVRLQASEEVSRAWGALVTSVRTGQTAFDAVFGSTNWTYQRQHPAFAALFNAWTSSNSLRQAAAVLAAYDFARFQTVVDVGGGRGDLLARCCRLILTCRASSSINPRSRPRPERR